MSTFEEWFRPRLRTLQIVTFALVAGVVAATVITAVLRGGRAPAEGQLISLIAVGFFMMQAAMSFVVPVAVGQAALRNLARTTAAIHPQEALFGVLQSTRIVRLALLEGALMFIAIAYFLEGHGWVFAATLVGLPLMLWPPPTEGAVLTDLEQLGARLADLRQQG